MHRQHARRFNPPSLSLRLWVVCLALLQFIAPTWHICEMGGHAMSMGAAGMAFHHGELPQARSNPDGTPQALICYCPAKPDHRDAPYGPRLTANHSDTHATCLALLLQTMPGTLADPVALARLDVPVTFDWQVATQTSHPVAFFGRFRGRAPPLTI